MSISVHMKKVLHRVFVCWNNKNKKSRGARERFKLEHEIKMQTTGEL